MSLTIIKATSAAPASTPVVAAPRWDVVEDAYGTALRANTVLHHTNTCCLCQSLLPNLSVIRTPLIPHDQSELDVFFTVQSVTFPMICKGSHRDRLCKLRASLLLRGRRLDSFPHSARDQLNRNRLLPKKSLCLVTQRFFL